MASEPFPSFEPFSESALKRILRVTDSSPDLLHCRESTYLEFKESFNWAGCAKYARTCAAFANTRGGYLVFGIADKARRVVGLQTTAFDNRDPATITQYFNEHFSPEIKWDAISRDFSGHRLGIIYTHENTAKPVICTRTDQDIQDGVIYYRYRGRTSAIRHAELRSVIDEVRQKDQDLWLHHIQNMAKIDVRKTGILDLASGTVTDPAGSFVIDESLLDRISVIRESQSGVKTGAPTIRIIGDAEAIPRGTILPTRTIFKTRTLRTPQIIQAFLDQTKVSNPKDYLEGACFETHAYLPIYYFIRLARITRDDTIKLITRTKSTSWAKDSLIRRLTGPDGLRYAEFSEQTHARLAPIRHQLLGKMFNSDIPDAQIVSALQAVRTLHNRQVDPTYLCPLLKKWFDAHYADPAKKSLAWELRQAICFVDRTLNRSATNDP
jgi:hypothetical protein